MYRMVEVIGIIGLLGPNTFIVPPDRCKTIFSLVRKNPFAHLSPLKERILPYHSLKVIMLQYCLNMIQNILDCLRAFVFYVAHMMNILLILWCKLICT